MQIAALTPPQRRTGLPARTSRSAASVAPIPGAARLSRPLRHCIDHIAANYAERVSLSDLARLSNLTVFQVIRAFRRELGTTPHAYLVAVRVDRAAALLAGGGTVAAVAAETGFSDQSHFGRHFKKLCGTTPRQFSRAIGDAAARG